MKKLLRVLGAIWSVACVSSLVWAVSQLHSLPADDQFAYEVTFLHLVAIVLLNFPLGFVALASGAAPHWFLHWMTSSLAISPLIAETVLAWLLACSAGYIQWFKLLPFAVRRMRGANKAMETHASR